MTASRTTAAVTPTHARITVPDLAHGTANGWRRLITAIPADAAGTPGLDGPWLPPRAVVEVPIGALVLAVDHHRAAQRWEITALLATTTGLQDTGRWSRRSPLGPREIRRLRTLLADSAHQHTARVLITPNRADASCLRCSRDLAAGEGMVHHTVDGRLLVCQTCPPRPAELPTNPRAGRCAVCQGWVATAEGTATLLGGHGDTGRYRPIHRACPEQPLPGPPLAADAWCLDCRTTVPAGTGYWRRGAHHAPGTCAAPSDGLPRWIVAAPARENSPWQRGAVRRIHYTPRHGEPQLPAGLPGGRILSDTGHMSVLAYILGTRTTGSGRTLALTRAATWTEAAPVLAAELDAALATRPDGGTFLAREVIERIHGDKGWVAELTGHDPRHGLARTFLRPQTDYDQADARGHRGVLDAWTLRPRRVYEVSRPLNPPVPNWRTVRRTLGPRARVTGEQRAYVRVTAEGDIIEITREEVDAWLGTALEWMY
ncbi:hypothetical protein OG413_40910 [Streptomyces sp. NBC_01433]|uniref:hypothetical protein n=1 Tax=Streptomyces sp. NBC_01433 TaxID=2903864 RepID=UPI002256B11A|nr:hypothetical protein [Streptomyces sp. NBC_01433]MCX4681564.1 hypothetical protein [Streptomyces sp. NBC_01433]